MSELGVNGVFDGYLGSVDSEGKYIYWLWIYGSRKKFDE